MIVSAAEKLKSAQFSEIDLCPQYRCMAPFRIILESALWKYFGSAASLQEVETSWFLQVHGQKSFYNIFLSSGGEKFDLLTTERAQSKCDAHG